VGEDFKGRDVFPEGRRKMIGVCSGKSRCGVLSVERKKEGRGNLRKKTARKSKKRSWQNSGRNHLEVSACRRERLNFVVGKN